LLIREITIFKELSEGKDPLYRREESQILKEIFSFFEGRS